MNAIDAYNTELCIFKLTSGKIQILLRKNHKHIYLPGKLIERHEDARDVAYNLCSKYKVNIEFIRHYAVFDEPSRDIRGRVISNAFYVLTRSHNKDFIDIDNIDFDKLSYDHKEIIFKALDNLKKDLLESMVAKYLLPEEFTIRMLKELLLSVCSDPRFLRSHFYTKIVKKEFIKPVLSDGLHQTYLEKDAKKPSKLYYMDDVNTVTSIYF